MHRALLLFGTSAMFLGCGGIAVFDEGQGGDAASGVGVGSTRTASATRASTAVQATTQVGAHTTPVHPDIAPTIVGARFLGSCKPGGGGDPLTGAIDVAYTNVGSATGSINVVAAQIAFSNPMEGFVFSFDVDPTSSGDVEAGQVRNTTHKKLPSNDIDAFVCQLCGAPANVTITYDNAQVVSAPATFDCAF